LFATINSFNHFHTLRIHQEDPNQDVVQDIVKLLFQEKDLNQDLDQDPDPYPDKAPTQHCDRSPVLILLIIFIVYKPKKKFHAKP